MREDNATEGKTYVYTYDNFGNITKKKVYPYTTGSLGTATSTVNYTYGTDSDAGWKNLLTKYGNETIDYDAIGNPVKYRGATLTWYGRELKKFVKNGTTVNYTYDAEGLRSSKTINGAKTTYQYLDGQLLYEDRAGTDIYYYYDSYGTPTAITYVKADGTSYTFYIGTNSLGDVNAIYNSAGGLAIKYDYDAWGRIVAETNATGGTLSGLAAEWNEINPFRYRGYYYDKEIGLYYLQSRYYDAQTGRFINCDSQLNSNCLLGYNTYSYCYNNPVNNSDPTGNIPGALTLTGVATVFKYVAVALVGLIVATVVYPVVKQITDTVVEIVKTKPHPPKNNNQSVYVLTDPNDNDNVKYVGRTKSPNRRANEHKNSKKHPERKNYDMTVIKSDLSVNQARVFEQFLISVYTLDYLDNMRREIAVGNIDGYRGYLDCIIELFGSFAEDELISVMRR